MLSAGPMTSTSSEPKLGSHNPVDLKERIKTHEELQYLNLISSILTHGEKRGDRTGTGTLSLFAPSAGNFRFTLGPATWSADGATSTAPFPLLTTKRVGLRMVFEELIWFVKGLTDGQILKDKGMHNRRRTLQLLFLSKRRISNSDSLFALKIFRSNDLGRKW